MERVKRREQDAVTPAISVMLLVLLTVIIAIIIYAFIYGIPGGLEKSAFIAAEAGVVEINGTEYVAIQHRGGDAVFLNGSGAAGGSQSISERRRPGVDRCSLERNIPSPGARDRFSTSTIQQKDRRSRLIG